MTQETSKKPGQAPQTPKPAAPNTPKTATSPDKRHDDQKGNAPRKDKPAAK